MRDWVVGVGHHRPLTPEDQPWPPIPDQERPVLAGWWHSLDQHEQLSEAFELYPVSFLRRWRSVCQNTNVYRTLRLFSASSRRDSILGPFVVDIDHDEKGNLEDALEAARQTVKLCVEQWNMTEEDCQVFFSGHKGFNIEIRPEALGIAASVERQIELSWQKLDLIIRTLRQRNGLPGRGNAVSRAGTVIDRIYCDNLELRHPYIRLPDSVNSWVGSDSVPVSRLRIHLTIEELHRLPLAAILSRAAK